MFVITKYLNSVIIEQIYPLLSKGEKNIVDASMIYLLCKQESTEFIYPAKWVGYSTLLYRAVEKTEFERALHPPPITTAKSINLRRSISESVMQHLGSAWYKQQAQCLCHRVFSSSRLLVSTLIFGLTIFSLEMR